MSVRVSGTAEGPGRGVDPSVRSTRDAVRHERLLRAAQRGDPYSREMLVASHLGLVRSVASRYRDLGLPFDDLVQEGSLGLLDAIEQYDRSHRSSFESYAGFRVRRAIRNALTDQARLIRLPKQMVERRRAIARAEARLAAEASGRPPTPAELAVDTGLTVAAVVDARSAGIEHDETEQLRAALERLPERQRRTLSLRWGIGGVPMSNAEVATELEVSPHRAQAIGRDALYELRAALNPTKATP